MTRRLGSKDALVAGSPNSGDAMSELNLRELRRVSGQALTQKCAPLFVGQRAFEPV